MLLSNRATKIVATIGPASRNREVLSQLIDAGVNVVRMNFSHGEHADHKLTYDLVREIAAEKGVAVGILQDLQGPKIRVGKFASGPVELVPGNPFIITADEVPGDVNIVSTSYKGLVGDVKPGMVLLLDDGILQLRVEKVEGTNVHTIVEIGGKLSDKKGINVPEAALSVPALSEKDIKDLIFGAQIGVDWVALSFVRSRDDLLLARHYLNEQGSNAKLMAKIEKPTAVERFDEILDEADGIMVARGDLGVEMNPEQVPLIQKELIHQCRRAGKPVITATQMLESMKDNPRPTRAEASDVANAIFDGTDAIMLSAESASGKYPVESVKMMDRIAREVESSKLYRARLDQEIPHGGTTQESIAAAACSLGKDMHARAITCFSATGATAYRVSRHRPELPIVALTPNKTVLQQLALSWGVVPRLVPEITDTDHMLELAHTAMRDTHQGEEGDTYVIVAGVPFGQKGTTNMIRLSHVK